MIKIGPRRARENLSSGFTLKETWTSIFFTCTPVIRLQSLVRIPKYLTEGEHQSRWSDCAEAPAVLWFCYLHTTKSGFLASRNIDASHEPHNLELSCETQSNSVCSVNPYKPSVLCVGHWQTVQTQIRRRTGWSGSPLFAHILFHQDFNKKWKIPPNSP